MSTVPSPATLSDPVRRLLGRWREDTGGTYQTWFLWEERLKNFRSIRRGIAAVVAEIEAGTFGNVYKGSSLETVVGSIAEQRQIFKGADHAFLWKPKLRIPDIYENRSNQFAFANFLDTCACCTGEAQVIGAIQALDRVFPPRPGLGGPRHRADELAGRRGHPAITEKMLGHRRSTTRRSQ